MPAPFIIPSTSELQTLQEIRDWHRDIVNALIEQQASVQNAIRVGSAVPDRFVTMTVGDVDAHYDSLRRNLDRLTMLNLVASSEATIRADYFRRIKRRLKDPLSRAYRKWHKGLSEKKQQRPDFDGNGILDVLKKAGVMNNNILGQYRECLQVRHWVGHGRYWNKPRPVNQLSPNDVYVRANALIQAMPS